MFARSAFQKGISVIKQRSIEPPAGESELQLVLKQSSLDHVNYSSAISCLCPAVTSVSSLSFRLAILCFFFVLRENDLEVWDDDEVEKENRQIYLRWITRVVSREKLLVFYLAGSSHCIRRCNLRPRSPRPPWDTTSHRNRKIKVSRRRTFSDVTSRINISSDDLTTRSGSVGRENANGDARRRIRYGVARHSHGSNSRKIWWRKIHEVPGKSVLQFRWRNRKCNNAKNLWRSSGNG